MHQLLIRASVVAFALVACADARAQSPESRSASNPPSLEELAERLRGGAWSLDDLKALMEGLTDKNYVFARRWWTAAAEEALKDKKLPIKAADSIRTWRSHADRVNAPSPAMRDVWKKTHTLARGLLAKNARKEAAEAAALMSALCTTYVEPQWTREHAALVKSMEKASKTSAGSGNPDEAERKLLDGLTTALRADCFSRFPRAIDQFFKFGCSQGFVIVDTIARNGTDDAPARETLKRVHDAARSYGRLRDLEIHILGRARALVLQDGVVVPGEEKGDGGRDLSAPSPIKLRALPLEQIAIQLQLPADAPRIHRTLHGDDVPYAELFVKATCDGKVLTPDAWRVGEPATIPSVRPETKDTLVAYVGMWKGKKSPEAGTMRMRYSYTDLGPLDEDISFEVVGDPLATGLLAGAYADMLAPAKLPYTAWHKEIEAKTPAKAGFTWIMTTNKDPVYFLSVPGPPPGTP